MVRLLAYLMYTLVVGVLSAIEGFRPRRDHNRMLASLALQFGGTHQPERRDYVGAATWTLDGTPAVLFIPEHDNGRAKGVTFWLHKRCSFRLRLLPETAWRRVRRFFGAQDLQTGDAAFDRAFIVQADRESKARAVLARDVRAALVDLARFGSLSLELGPNGIVLRTTEKIVGQWDGMAAFTREARGLASAILQALDPTVVITDVDVSGAGTCPVCGTAVEEDRSLCARCRTPHHKDCWNYLGGCAIFACAGRPRRMRALPRRNRVRAA